MSEPNPFTPTFGVTPPVLVGRQSIIREADQAIVDGPGAPGRAMLITGSRGTGKTVTLNAIEDQARKHGWIVITEDARPGLFERLSMTYANSRVSPSIWSGKDAHSRSPVRACLRLSAMY